MGNQSTISEQKLFSMMQYAPLGIAETDETGKIAFLNLLGKTMLSPLFASHNLNQDNLFSVLRLITPSVMEKIDNFHKEAGLILMNEVYSCSIPSQEGPTEKYINFIVNKISPDSIIISFDDITEKYLKERAMQRAQLEGAIEQGKLEIASGVLHDIGNAVVGFGSYLTRIKRALELNKPDHLENLSMFFADLQGDFAGLVGKAKAVVDMLKGITLTQKASREEIGKSISEQLNIITHIQEILNIQRQYVSGQETGELKPVNLRSIINDCMAMLFASFDKRAIAVSINIPSDLPLIKGDRTKLMQVILNVFKNSLEAIDSGSGEKKVSIQAYTKPHLLVLQVQDSGIGFDKITAQQFFKRGFTTKNSGTGLGLYNSKIIIESYGGSIDISSEGHDKGALTIISFAI